MNLYRVRLTSEGGFYDLCGLMAIGPPSDQGTCSIYRHPRRDLTKERAEELMQKMREAGRFDPSKWEYLQEYDSSKIL